ncbi:E3 ubiquitin-protein ligase Ubr3 isoform X2 [Anoplophora glabripennis]|uniref:E3 ubiquitin-protein ligase Ubr3 isoform X2 n=1 Tax=Anoplophora glabripennis TaxID=217634 RepID=UPI000C75E82D|nr:E3 ubiquitin-protein ligase Ubr3 isoform X2 [Anoplophora glabripennis]
MASTSSFEAKVLMSKGKRATAAYIHADCSNERSPQHLNEVLDNLLNPAKAIDEWETIDWCKWLMAGGRTPDEFSSTVRAYDNATTCGLVWTPNFVAYRCRTCGISPCMSLCTECFKKGNHARHDFNMFLSQAGGACDCGDTSVMKETGFCDRHGPNKAASKGKAPTDLMCVAEAMMPRIILRLIQHLRENSKTGTPDAYKGAIQDADGFITMLLDFNNMGGLMRRVMTSALTNPQKYRVLNEVPENLVTEYAQYQNDSKRIYEEALNSLPNPKPIEDYKDCPSLQENLVHKTFLEELVFRTVKFEFPQKVVCLLLNMLPDPDYKEALTRAFVLHYSRISMMLERSVDPDTLSNRVVHVSVQLFSNESLALRMTEHLNLLHVMVVSLKYMMSKILIKNTLHDQNENFHYVVDCGKPVMKDHCYWPLVSDLNNVLSHRPVALKFMSDDSLLEMWFTFLAMFQGMNVNQRELNQHIEFEPNTYYAAFSAELEASAYPMWALVSHLTDATTASLTRRVLSSCLNELKDWLDAINFTSPTVNDSLQVTFHLPLHRYLAVFLCQAVAKQEITLNEVLPSTDTFLNLLMMHPLRVQVAFYEILNGLWVRNGLQIKGQAMTYIQCNFCNSMVDADLYLLQICATRIATDNFLNTVIEKFHVKEWMSLAPYQAPQNAYLEGEHDTPMLESFLTFLATLISVRTNLGLSETALNRLEMVTLLCMGDKTHSQLMELMPERCGTSQSRDFESLLAEVADYRAPALEASGNMQQGMYVPKPLIWENQYDPIHVLLRAVHRRDFQTSMDRYTEYARQANKLKPGISPWPPFRTPADCSEAYEDPRQILKSRVFHAAVLVILYKAVKGHVSEHVMALVMFLLEQAVIISQQDDNKNTKMCSAAPQTHNQLNDMDLTNWFTADSLFDNLRTVVGRVILTPESDFSPITYSSDSDLEWEGSEVDTEMPDITMDDTKMLMLGEGSSNWDSNQEQSASTDLMVFRGQQDQDSPAMETTPTGSVLALPSSTSVPMEVERIMSVALPAYISVNHHASSSSAEPPALPSPAQLPALTAGNEIGRAVIWSRPGPSSKELVPSTSQNHRKSYPYRRRQTVERPITNPPSVKVNESIISLLLRLHSQLSGVPDSYNLEEDEEENSSTASTEAPIGDGAYYVGKLLRKISASDSSCKTCIQETRMKLWPSQEEREEAKKQRENKEREERRRRAKERQQKLMAEFANKQKQFMEKAMEIDENSDNMEEEVLVSKQEYDCVICNQSTPSTEEKPMGLVVLIQATSVIGHRRRYGQPERSVLPTCEEEREFLRRDDTLAAEFDRRVEELDRHFDPSWFLSVNLGWDGGVHVQTCGHHLHLDCLNSYLQSLRSQQRQPTLSPEKGEYLCPLCRQLANSVLPLSPQLGDKTQMVRSRPNESMSQILEELSNFLRENDQKPSTSNMAEAIGKVMEDMSSSTQLKPMFKPKSEKPIPQSLFLFVTSIARTNLEVELIQRGGSLVISGADPPNPLLPKRDCIVPLLHVLAVHARVARVLAMWPAWMTFQQLCGLPAKVPVTALAPIEREVPLLLRDPIALLLQFVLLLPLHLDQTYFTTTVQMVYNLLYYQVVAQVSCGLTGAERARAASGATEGRITNLCDSLNLINECLGQTDLYMEDDSESCSGKTQVNILALEQQVQKLCLLFLRIASLLKYHLYQQPLPDIRAAQSEFVRLVYYLELVTESMDWGCFNASVALNWPSNTNMFTDSPRSWCSQFASFISKSQIAARSFLVDQHIVWHPPRLLQLPREYEKIFTYYHERPCSQCHSVAQETSICLLCGTIVCLKQNCCKQQNVCEAVAHAAECGAGTGVFLVVTSTYIIVIRGHRACLWGSLYLDDFEEEDRDLKRGKPLYLSKDRYQLLEQQWLAHRFDHTKKTWVHHRNAL